LRPRKPDCLRPTDDEDVAAAMMDPNFAMGPHLAGRSVETAGLARLARDFAPTLSGRLAARFAEMAATLDSIGALVAGGEAPDDLVTAKNTGAGASFAAVESARGRLYHAMRLDGDGRIADYAILAPTEWNFHPEGPFVQSLRDGSIGTGEQARLRVARLAFVFDPCIRVGVDLRDSADA
jgi:coenzyme F420-reducing hydrogenase alpha subunit